MVEKKIEKKPMPRRRQVGPYRLPTDGRLPLDRRGVGDDVASLVARSKRHLRGVAGATTVTNVDEDVRIARPTAAPRRTPRDGLFGSGTRFDEDDDID